MEIPQYILDEAKKIAQSSAQLPAQIKSAPEFYVTKGDDTSIQAFGAISINGKEYKVGTQKSN